MRDTDSSFILTYLRINKSVLSNMKSKFSVHVIRLQLVLLILLAWPLFMTWRSCSDVRGFMREDEKAARYDDLHHPSNVGFDPRTADLLTKQRSGHTINPSELKSLASEVDDRPRSLNNPSNVTDHHSTEQLNAIRGVEKGSSTLVNCEGRRIFMYDLPPDFNDLLLQQCDRKIADWLDFCAHIQNEGFGRQINSTRGWYGTDFYMLDVIFNERMKRYGCRTTDWKEADAFFIPYYGGLDALRFLYGKERRNRRDQGIELAKWLQEKGGEGWKVRGGEDHFMVMGRTAWDFGVELIENEGVWGTSLSEQPKLFKITKLLIESRPWKSQTEQAIPYPSSFHPSSISDLHSWLSSVQASPRRFLFTFTGAPRPGPLGSIRQIVLHECLQSPNICGLLDCQKIKCAHNPEPIRDMLLQSQFCLQPPGDSPTRRSTFDGLIAGCIPIFFHNDSAYSQYTWHLPQDPDHYSVFISPHDLLHKGLKVQDVLSRYSEERISRMRQNIIEMIPRLIYVSSSAVAELASAGMKDAFDVSLEAMLAKAAAMKSSTILE